MGTKYIFMFTFLAVQVLCDQKNSLTFVIDDTSSMYDDISQVRSAAKSIIDIVLNEKSSQIEDIVVVTFNDPTFGFRHRTRNEVELKQALDRIHVHEGGDCEEMSLSGIKVALEESQPGSYLFVFSDASAKDYRKFNEIKALCQEKQSQIVFVLTGDCGSLSSPDSQVYYKIAAASNGQVFRISKGEVGQVGTATHLIISVKDDEHSVNIQNVEILDMNERVIQRLPLTSAKPLSTELEGNMQLYDHEIRRGKPKPHITWYFRQRGASQFKLLPGKTDDVLPMNNVLVRDTGDYQCVVENIAGRATHILQLEVFGLPAFEKSPSVLEVRQSANLDIQCKIRSGNPPPAITWQFKTSETGEFHIIDNFGERLRIFNVQQSNSGFYKCEAKNNIGTAQQITQVIVLAPARIVFIPPNSPFYEGVEGDVVMRLPCTAVGFPKPSVSWIVDQDVVGKDKSRSLYVEDDVFYLKNPQRFNSSNYSKNITHTYVCHAVNDFGKDKQSYEVTVLQYADYESNNTDEKYAEAKKPYDLNCPLPYTDPNSVRWFYDSTIMNKTGPILHFDDPTRANSGNYTCRVSDLNGAASYTIELKFDYPPSVSRLVYEAEWNGNEEEITCNAEILYGKYEWFYRGVKVKEAYADKLELSLIGWGQYVCRVTNPLGTLNITYNIHAKDKPERPCESIEECCYESVQLVNAADVSAGPAEKATFRKPLNTVSYCKPNDENTTSWHDIETKVREKASQSRLMIWSGTVNFTTVDKLLVPQYLWKVVKDLDNEEILTIVHSNEQAPQAASLCENVCQKSWFEPYGPRTYCFWVEAATGKMDAKYIFWLTFLVAQASCEQKKSLTFVIDSTISMKDDITHVRKAAKSIMDIVLKEKSSQIEDIVLVVFVLTGDCGDFGSPKSQVYYKIAAASNGQVFRISKGEVGQIFDYVKETIKGDMTVITSEVVPPHKWYTVHVRTTTHLIISVKDDEHSVNIQNVEILDMNERVIQRLPLTNVGGSVYATTKFLPPNAMFKVARGASQFKLLPGKADDVLLMNNVLVRDTGDYQCVAENIAGRATHIVQLEVFGLPAFEKSPSVLEVRQSANLDIQCKIRSGNPPPAITWQFKTSETGEYHNIDNFGELLRIFNVQQSNSGFYKCEAKNNIGTTQQIAQVIVLVNPEFEDTPAKITEKENAPVTLMCKIRRGKPKPHITWYFRQRGASQFKLLPGKTDDVLLMNNVLVRDTGDYQCVAENIAGRATHKVQLEVFGLPAFEKSPSVLKVRQSANLDIQCKIRSGNPPPAITWQFKTSETGEYHNIDNFGELLRIFNVQQSNSGFYKCEAKNNIGTTQQIAQVIVLVNPEFEDTPAKITEKENAPVTLKCKIRRGKPKPHITWYFRQRGASQFKLLPGKTDDVLLMNVLVRDTGDYQCVAENIAGRATHKVQLEVFGLPAFEKSPSVLEVRQSANLDIQCKIRSGNPPPAITWQFKTSETGEYHNIDNFGELLRIFNVQQSNSGFYKCEAKNNIGTTQQIAQVIVLVNPEFEDTPAKIMEKENAPVTLKCKLHKGNPRPKITWYFQASGSKNFTTLSNSGEELRLPAVQLKDSGEYRCVAENSAGRDERTMMVTVLTPARIVFIPPNSPFYEGVEGDVVMRLPCTAVGFPKPSVSWIVDQDVVGKDKSRSLYVEDDVFYLKNPQRFNSSNYSKNITHTYVCHAVNDFGKDKQSYEVTVLQYADYESNNTDEKYAEAKKPYDLNCPLPYTDPNSVRWFYDLTIMNKTGPILHFDDPTRANSGNYTCRVSDLNGAASYTIELKFDYPPSVSRLVYEAEWNGNEEEITCNAEILYGKYEWFYRGVKVKEAYDDKLELSLIGWGQYVCRVTNPLGTLNITYNIHAKDDWPKSKSYSQSESNSFMKFPNTKSIIATCDHEDLFLVDGVTYKLSELDCKHEVSSSVVPIKECLGSDTTMMSVGFNVNGFLDVYKSCLDTKRNVVLFTEVITTGADQFGYTDKPERPCESIEECCYESVQLVNAADVSAGPAEKATFGKPLNTVSYCKPNDENTTSWHDIETKVREKASQSRLMIWSGTVNYTTVDKLLVPQYLWKVVKDLDNEEILTIVHSNEQAPQASLCESVCQKSWFEPYGPRTYCCRLEEFKKVFNLTINF
ncbi:hypothetical protein MSG28_009229 [Choristoneura fumiferana]|uniref:Uncharacterized protein n=1 Tax=Choristoneura fumiferana TaxID=7141 RepID=A0ACC0KWT6_CHOFU|nr:hypothetical protein MSG28_009229 [Choristoneura fumiferana]